MKPISQSPLVTHLLQTSYRSFVSRAFATLRGERALSNDRYLDHVCHVCEGVSSGLLKRVLLNMPPRTGKTLTATVCLAAWHLAHHPSDHILIICYGDDLAKSIAYDIRKIMRSDWFRSSFKCRIAEDRSSVSDFQTTSGGGVFATSMGGAITGRGADLIIVDDPHKIDDARYPDQLEKVCGLFETTIMSRLNNPKTGSVIVVAHRIHELDLTGYLLRWMAPRATFPYK